MSSSESETECMSVEDAESGENAVDSNVVSIPDKSKKRYLKEYNEFSKWKLKKGYAIIDENTLIEYFVELSEVAAPISLWNRYSMLKNTLFLKENIDFTNYFKLREFIKKKNTGYEARQWKTFTPKQIIQFINEAPDQKYLFHKVIISFGLIGRLSSKDMHNLNVKDVEHTRFGLLIKMPRAYSNFVLPGKLYEIYKKYAQVRNSINAVHSKNLKKLFLRYRHGKCMNQSAGVNKIGSVPKDIAEYLNLKDSKDYTGHALKRLDGNITTLINFYNSKTCQNFLEKVTDCDSISSRLLDSGYKTDAATMTDPLEITYSTNEANLSFLCKFGVNSKSRFMIPNPESHSNRAGVNEVSKPPPEESHSQLQNKLLEKTQASDIPINGIEVMNIVQQTQGHNIYVLGKSEGQYILGVGSEHEIIQEFDNNQVIKQIELKNEPKIEVAGLKEHHCQKCGFNFEEEILLEEHMKSH